MFIHHALRVLKKFSYIIPNYYIPCRSQQLQHLRRVIGAAATVGSCLPVVFCFRADYRGSENMNRGF
jgi:hypothetical protein